MSYAIVQAMRAIRANWVASVSTITTMTLSLTILAGFSLVSVNLNAVLQNLQSELQIAAFLDDNAQVAQLEDTIRSWPEVASVSFVSKKQALANMVQSLPSLQQASGLIANPLPNTLEIRLRDPSQTPVVRSKLQQLPGVSHIEDSSNAVRTFLAINSALRVSGSILIVVLLSAALFAIVNSIRAAIAARSDEIEVMRLVGATRGFIRSPFLIEGFLLGLISAAITLALAVPGYQFVVARLSNRLTFIPFVHDTTTLEQIAGLLAALSVLVGLVGSAISVSQHLREPA